MRLFQKIFATACLASAALLPGLAQADEVPPAVKAFLDNLQRQTAAKPAYEALKSDGNGNVTLTNLTFAKEAKGEEPGLSVKAAEVNFTGITDEGASLYQVGKASFTNTSVQMTGKDISLTATIPNASAEGWYIRAVPASPSPQEELLSAATFARQMTSGPISITAAGQTVSVDSIDTTWTGDPATGTGKFTLKVNNVALPESLVALMDEGGLLKQLGYPSLNLDMASDADLTVKGEKLAYGFDVSLAGRNMGAIKVAAELDDVPITAYAQMVKAQSEGKALDMNALYPQLQNVVVKDASVSFTDSSIFKKLLPLAAAMQGLDEKTFIASIPPSLQLTLIHLQNEAFTKQAVDAVTRFIADPKSITLSAKPAAPLKVSEFGVMDPAKPGDAITKMGLSVTAND